MRVSVAVVVVAVVAAVAVAVVAVVPSRRVVIPLSNSMTIIFSDWCGCSMWVGVGFQMDRICILFFIFRFESKESFSQGSKFFIFNVSS